MSATRTSPSPRLHGRTGSRPSPRICRSTVTPWTSPAGRGSTALFLASRGLNVIGIDVSRVAITAASRRATELGLDDLARFEVVDLDGGLPDGPPLALATCHLFRDARLDDAIVERLAPGGLLAIAALSEVGAEPGPFRVAPGELVDAFEPSLSVVYAEESNGVATLIGRRAS